MGQYYKAVFYDHKVFMNAYDHTGTPTNDGLNGLKLMEHSYIGNPLLNAVENRLHELGGARIVWAGEYADPEPHTVISESDEGNNLYDLIQGRLQYKFDTGYQKRNGRLRYLINYDKKEDTDLRKCRKDNDGLIIHPLPLLTCEGNGEGGGAYHGDETYVGRWTRDLKNFGLPPMIGIDTKKPKRRVNQDWKDFVEIIPDFFEA
ncbi:MAG: hypothetical protein ACOC22_01895 [bacterium]